MAMKTLSGILTFLFIHLASFASATERSFETALAVPWEFIRASLNGDASSGAGSTNREFLLNDVTLEIDDAAVMMPNIKVEVASHFNPVISLQNETFWETENLGLQITIEGLTVKKTVTQIRNGVVVIVHLRADCDAFTLSQNQALAQAYVRWQTTGGQLVTRFRDVRLAWPQGSWVLSPIQCQGPTGFVRGRAASQIARAPR
jgi:hypothetical protein